MNGTVQAAASVLPLGVAVDGGAVVAMGVGKGLDVAGAADVVATAAGVPGGGGEAHPVIAAQVTSTISRAFIGRFLHERFKSIPVTFGRYGGQAGGIIDLTGRLCGCVP